MSDGTVTLRFSSRAFDRPEMPIPPVYRVRQRLDAPVERDVDGAARSAVQALLSDPRLRPGARVAVCVGSRGMANLHVLAGAVIDELRRAGCRPVVIPAMGSHGNATTEGQVEILRGYGVTAEAMGVPVWATMDTRPVSTLPNGFEVVVDAHAARADAIVVINRIKPHTDFHGEIESGLCKMLAIGLGKQVGADRIHRYGAEGLRDLMPRVGRAIADALPVVGGVGVIENPFGQTAEVHAVPGSEIGGPAERRLLGRARELSPRLPVSALDVLVVDLMGKDISGAGMDTHVIGRARMPSIPEAAWDGPDVRMVCTLDLTDATHGNAAGLGLADVVTQRLIERVDFETTFTNFRTSGEGAAYRVQVPLVMDTAEGCVRAAMGLCGRGDPGAITLARIRNTEHVQMLEVNGPALEACGDRVDVLSGPHPMDLARALPA